MHSGKAGLTAGDLILHRQMSRQLGVDSSRMHAHRLPSPPPQRPRVQDRRNLRLRIRIPLLIPPIPHEPGPVPVDALLLGRLERVSDRGEGDHSDLLLGVLGVGSGLEEKVGEEEVSEVVDAELGFDVRVGGGEIGERGGHEPGVVDENLHDKTSSEGDIRYEAREDQQEDGRTSIFSPSAYPFTSSAAFRTDSKSARSRINVLTFALGDSSRIVFFVSSSLSKAKDETASRHQLTQATFGGPA
jgi:hypothetical protein